MSRAPVSTSQRPATNVVGTSMAERRTRACLDTPRASRAYQAGCVVKNSFTMACRSAVSAAGSMSRARRSRSVVERVQGSLRVTGARP